MQRVWTYVIGKPMSDEELAQFTHAGQTFVEHWTAHDKQLSATFEIFKGRIVVVKVNEEVTGASGCSIDKLQRFMKVSETMYGVPLLDRMLVAVESGDKLQVISAQDVKALLQQGALTADSIVYNTAVANDREFAGWKQPLSKTWLSRYLESKN